MESPGKGVSIWTAVAERSGDTALEMPSHFRLGAAGASKEINGNLEMGETLESGVAALLCHRSPKSSFMAWQLDSAQGLADQGLSTRNLVRFLGERRSHRPPRIFRPP